MSETICIVEDDALVRAQIAGVLEAAGYQTIEADSADHAVTVLEKRNCMGAVIDILMPQRDGLDLIRELRETQSDLRIVAISGGGRVSAALYLKFAAEVGADVCLEKPVDPEALVRAFRGAPVTAFEPVKLRTAQAG